VKQTLLDILERFCPDNVFLQGTRNPEESYPSELLTYWTNYTEDGAHYDNAVASVDWNFYVIYYADDVTKVNTKPLEIAAALKAAGFVQQGKGRDVLSDEPTHTGWAMEFTYSEKIK
jgi:hypothetical protein